MLEMVAFCSPALQPGGFLLLSAHETDLLQYLRPHNTNEPRHWLRRLELGIGGTEESFGPCSNACSSTSRTGGYCSRPCPNRNSTSEKRPLAKCGPGCECSGERAIRSTGSVCKRAHC